MVVNKFVVDDGIVIIRLSGKLIASTLEPLQTAIDGALKEDPPRIVLHFRMVNIVDSVAVGMLISRFKTAKKKKGFLRFCELQPAVKKLLSLADLDKWLDIYATEEEAVESIRKDMKGE